MLDCKKQFYGSQLNTDEEIGQFYVDPIDATENMDKRQDEVGLRRLAEYLAMFSLKWDIKQHKELGIAFEKKEGL